MRTLLKGVNFCSIVFLGFSCGGNTKPAVSEKKDSVKVEKKKEVVVKNYDRTVNDISRFIAGLPSETGSNCQRICEEDTNWKNYSVVNSKEWEKVNTNRIQKMDEWAKTSLKEEREKKADLFYPFSGPDILHAITFFPEAKNYYLMALEKCGSLPDINEMDSSAVCNYVNSLDQSLQDVFNKSYFITKKMRNDLSKDKVNGALPLLCIFLERTGNEVLDTKYYHLNEDGSYKETEVDSLKSFVKVDFRKTKTSDVQSVYYFRVNLEDRVFQKNTGLQAFLNKFDNCNTYLKSASYLLHYKNFNSIRNIILDKSQMILEDDTGIPYKYFTNDKWKLNLYGRYVRVTKDFAGVFQSDLLDRYQKDSTRTDLPFSLGYHWGDKYQNLLKAEKKNTNNNSVHKQSIN